MLVESSLHPLTARIIEQIPFFVKDTKAVGPAGKGATQTDGKSVLKVQEERGRTSGVDPEEERCLKCEAL